MKNLIIYITLFSLSLISSFDLYAQNGNKQSNSISHDISYELKEIDPALKEFFLSGLPLKSGIARVMKKLERYKNIPKHKRIKRWIGYLKYKLVGFLWRVHIKIVLASKETNFVSAIRMFFPKFRFPNSNSGREQLRRIRMQYYGGIPKGYK